MYYYFGNVIGIVIGEVTTIFLEELVSCTIFDIAERAQVSVSTVSRVLNNKPDVNIKTRAAVEAVIKAMNYSPSSVARGLVLKYSKVIGYIAGDITNPSFPELARAIVVRAKELGYSVMIFDARKDSQVEKDAISLLRSKQVDGIIVSFSDTNREEMDRLREEHFPVVQIYRKSPKSTISTIAIDNVGSGYIATKFLIEHGHVKIAHITTGESTQSGFERMQGYKKALEEAGISICDAYIVEGINSIESGKGCMDQLLNLPSPPTAVFTTHDLMAIGAYDALFNRGLSIPSDISIVGHDNIELSRHVRPRLTTIDTHKDVLGNAAVDMLVKQINTTTIECKEIVFKGDLIVRGSVLKL